MQRDLSLSIVLRVAAEQAKRELGQTTAEVKGLGAAAEAADRQMSAAAQGVTRAGTAVNVLAVQAGQSINQTINLAAQWGRTATAIGTGREVTTGLTLALRDQVAAIQQEQQALAGWQAELDGLRAKFNPIAAMTQQYEQALREIAEAERLGAITAAEAANARARAAQAMAPINTGLVQMADNTRNAGHFAGQLSFQLNDIFMMTAVGQSPWMLMMQQGPQVIQIMGQMRMQGLSLGTALRGALGMLVNPAGLATMAMIGLGAAGVQWLTSLSGETLTFDDHLETLNSTLGRMRTNLDLLANTRLGDTFGSLTAEVRALTRGMLEIDRAAQPRQLQTVVSNFLGREIRPSWWQNIRTAIGAGAAPMPGMSQEDYAANTPALARNYAALGAQNSYADFAARVGSIGQAAQAGNPSGVLQQIEELRAAMAGANPGELSAELTTLLGQLRDVAVDYAEIEARYNGSGRAEAITRQIDGMVRGYQQQAELTQAALVHGEQSVEVEAIRQRQAREALDVRLAEMGVQQQSAEWQRAHAALDVDQQAERAAAVDRRRKAEQQVLAELDRQEELSATILRFGEHSAEVEAVREMHAREIYEAQLRQAGLAPQLVQAAVDQLEAEQARQRLIRQQAEDRRAGDLLAELREEAAIGRATLAHGRDSVEVRRLQIAAERRVFEVMLDTMRATEAYKDELRAAWELARGLGSADPFGDRTAAREYLLAQGERIERMRLEQALLGQSEAARRRLIALWEVERDLQREGIDAASTRAAEIRAAALAEAELSLQLEREADAWRRVQSTAESAIDGIVDKLMQGDLEGAFQAVLAEITKAWTDLALTNPLKNALLGTNYATLQDAGGVRGIFARLLGRGDPAEIAARAVSSVATMQVQAATVLINGAPLGGLGLGGQGQGLGPGLSGSTSAPAIPDGPLAGLNAGFGQRLQAMMAEAERLFGAGAVQVTSGFRSVERQQQLWESALQRYGSPEAARQWVAPPGSSSHNHGLAADLRYGAPGVQDWFHANAGRYGLGFRMGHEPWHIEPQGARAMIQGQIPLPTAEIQEFGAAMQGATGNLGILGRGFQDFGRALGQAGIGGGGGGGGIFSWLINLGGRFLGLFADGAAFEAGVVSRPTLFRHGAGLGVLGEAGPEAIMPLIAPGAIGAMIGGRETPLPLTRLPSGKLGVQMGAFADGGILGGSLGGLLAAQVPPLRPSAPAGSSAGGLDVRVHSTVTVEDGAIKGLIETTVDERMAPAIEGALDHYDRHQAPVRVREVTEDEGRVGW